MEWSIQQLAKLAGTTSRTLRHYDEVGLLPPTRTAHNGYRYYDEDALVRLQRILLLRELGLGLPQISEVLARSVPETVALATHLQLLQAEAARLQRQIAAVATTIQAREKGTPLMAEEALDGFDHTQYKEEVETRWGKDAYAQSDAWWTNLTDAERADFKLVSTRLSTDWKDAALAGEDPTGPRAQLLAERHVAWLRSIPGTPAHAGSGLAEYVRGLGDMYVADPRFAANYGDGEHAITGAQFVRDALHAYVSEHLV